MTLVEIIRHALDHSELSIPAASRRAKVAAVTIEKWLAGTMPKANSLVRFLRACGIEEKMLAKWELPEADEEA
jgi:hypothetical protein